SGRFMSTRLTSPRPGQPACSVRNVCKAKRKLPRALSSLWRPRARGLLPAFEQITDLREQHLLPRQSRRLRRLGLDDPIQDPDHDEQDPSDDNEVEDDGEEISPRQDGALLFGFYPGIG